MAHSLSFKVMRLSKSALQPPDNFLLDLDTDFLPDDKAAEVFQDRKLSHSEASTSSRSHMTSPLDICNIPGLLQLPSNFGSLHLGEAFQSFVSAVNTSQAAVTSVHCKAELETSRAKVTLHDTGSKNLTLLAGGRHDFIVKHDVKEIGQHTLICSVSYTAETGERRILQQHFKFSSTNPISVRTKCRLIHKDVLLEACIENASKGPLVLDYVRFDPLPHLTAQQLVVHKPAEAEPIDDPALAAYVKNLQIISPNTGAHNMVYLLKRVEGKERSREAQKGTLGKLDIKWQTTMGGVGRLQTQPITAPAVAQKDVELQVIAVPKEIRSEQCFSLKFRVTSHVERRLRSLLIECRQDNEAVSPVGPTSIIVPDIQSMGSADVSMDFVAWRPSVQKLPDLILYEAGSQIPLDTLSMSVWVE